MLDVALRPRPSSLLMAQSGFDVHAIDRNPDAIAAPGELADRLGLTIDAQQLDLETTPPPDLVSHRSLQSARSRMPAHATFPTQADRRTPR